MGRARNPVERVACFKIIKEFGSVATCAKMADVPYFSLRSCYYDIKKHPTKVILEKLKPYGISEEDWLTYAERTEWKAANDLIPTYKHKNAPLTLDVPHWCRIPSNETHSTRKLTWSEIPALRKLRNKYGSLKEASLAFGMPETFFDDLEKREVYLPDELIAKVTTAHKDIMSRDF